jgi:hypothetical protein
MNQGYAGTWLPRRKRRAAFGPKCQFAAVQRSGRCRWNTGRSEHVADTAAPDPKPKWSAICSRSVGRRPRRLLAAWLDAQGDLDTHSLCKLNALRPMIIGLLSEIIEWSCAAAWSGAGVWPTAGATAPSVNPPANAPPPFRSSLRLFRFEPIGSSFEIDPIGLSFENDITTQSRRRGRKHTRPCQIWPVLMGRGLRILKRQPGSPSSCRVARRSRSSASSTKQRSQSRIHRPCRSV